jgi:hypothetical protein
MSGDCGVVEADVECAMFALTTPVLQGVGGDEGYRASSGNGNDGVWAQFSFERDGSEAGSMEEGSRGSAPLWLGGEMKAAVAVCRRGSGIGGDRRRETVVNLGYGEEREYEWKGSNVG